MGTVQAIYTYPLKSGAGSAVDTCAVEALGLLGDRRWMLVDPAGRFVTGRVLGGLVSLHADKHADGLRLSWRDGSVRTAHPDFHAAPLRVQVWRDLVWALPVQPQIDAWLSEMFSRPLRLVYQADPESRPLTREDLTGHVSLADGYPLLLTSVASLAALVRSVGRPLDMRRFRPNLVVDGGAPYAEDDWQRIRIGDVVFRVVSRCSRCIFTTVDPDTGERDAAREPLATLERERQFAEGACFGVNLLPELAPHGRSVEIGGDTPIIRIGDRLSVLEQSL